MKILDLEETNKIKQAITEGICSNMTGKMTGFWSFSTPCSHNEFCKKQQKISGSICEKCYAEHMMGMYSALDAKCLRNMEIVTKIKLTDDCIPEIDPDKVPYFRFEAFGDLNNELQLANYVKIAQCNPKVRFALWTKNIKIALAFFTKHKCPENMNILISSLMMDTPININIFYDTGSFSPGQCKVFTVYTKDFLEHHPETKINCGSRSCMGCSVCYRKTDQIYINEILKNEQSATEKMLIFRDPAKKKAYINNIAGLL